MTKRLHVVLDDPDAELLKSGVEETRLKECDVVRLCLRAHLPVLVKQLADKR